MHDSASAPSASRPDHLGLIIIWTAICTTIGLFILSKPNLSFAARENLLLTSSQLFALIGIVLLSFSFLLSSRLKVLESLFGSLDQVYRLHHLFGVSAFVLLINHPLFMAVDALPNSGLALFYLLPSVDLSYTLGILALYTMVALITATLFIRLPYHIWKATHEYMGIVILFGFLHVLLISSDVSRYLPLKIWILFVASLGIMSYLYRRFLYEHFGPVSLYRLSSLKRHDQITELYLSPQGPKISYRPGQFAFLSFPEKPGFKEAHPFSISSAPATKQVRFSIKDLGDYTKKIPLLVPGITVKLMGPYGQFLDRLPSSEIAVCIAGGIGITPFLSLLEADKKMIQTKKTFLFYSVKNQSAAYYSEKLSTLSRTGNFSYFLHDTSHQGKITAESIIASAKIDPKNATYFICGPLPLMESLRNQLLDLGVRSSRIIFEDFSLR